MNEPTNNITSRKSAITALCQNGLRLQHLSQFNDDKELVLKAVSQDGLALEFASERLKNDVDVVRDAIELYPEALKFAGNEAVFTLVKEFPNLLKYASLGATRFVVERNGVWLQNASEESKSNEATVNLAVCQDGLALEFADDILKINQTVVHHAVRQNGLALSFVELKKLKKEIVARCENYNPDGFLDGPDKIAEKAVYEIVSAAVFQNGSALEFASDTLRKNKTIVRAAVGRDGLALKYADEKLKNNPTTVNIAIENNPEALQYAGKDAVLAVLKKNGLLLGFVSNEFKNDPDVVDVAVRQNGLALKHASKDLQDHANTVLIAVDQNGLALQSASPKRQNDEKVVFHAISKDINAYEFASRERVLEAVARNGLILKHLGKKFQDDQEIVLAAVRQNGLALQFASELRRGEEKIALAAVGKDSKAIEYISKKELQSDLENLLKLQNHHFNIILNKAHKLKDKNASACAGELYHSLCSNYDDLMSTQKITISDFKNNAAQAIAKALPELEKHRGWKRFLTNLALVIGLNIFYLPALLVNKAATGHYRFFNKTDSVHKIDKMEKTLAKINGSQQDASKEEMKEMPVTNNGLQQYAPNRFFNKTDSVHKIDKMEKTLAKINGSQQDASEEEMKEMPVTNNGLQQYALQ